MYSAAFNSTKLNEYRFLYLNYLVDQKTWMILSVLCSVDIQLIDIYWSKRPDISSIYWEIWTIILCIGSQICSHSQLNLQMIQHMKTNENGTCISSPVIMCTRDILKHTENASDSYDFDRCRLDIDLHRRNLRKHVVNIFTQFKDLFVGRGQSKLIYV